MTVVDELLQLLLDRCGDVGGTIGLDFPRAVDQHAGQAADRRQKLLGSR